MRGDAMTEVTCPGLWGQGVTGGDGCTCAAYSIWGCLQVLLGHRARRLHQSHRTLAMPNGF